ncbi:hypothetical protein KDA00_03190 [Candidatus Saccharibacteria bacterium]|nr:hypothetical protein [Candidatus Saccharibacteria bacterium]
MGNVSKDHGFSKTTAIGVALVLAAIIAVTWFFLNKYDQSQNNVSTNDVNQTENTQSQENNENVEEAEEDKYLVIKEWGVKTEVPEDLRGKVTYALGETPADSDGHVTYFASIFVSRDALSELVCATETTDLGESVSTGSQYIRGSNNEPFSSRWNYKENILQDENYSYHLSYFTPDCLGGGEGNTQKIENLQKALEKLVWN